MSTSSHQPHTVLTAQLQSLRSGHISHHRRESSSRRRTLSQRPGAGLPSPSRGLRRSLLCGILRRPPRSRPALGMHIAKTSGCFSTARANEVWRSRLRVASPGGHARSTSRASLPRFAASARAYRVACYTHGACNRGRTVTARLTRTRGALLSRWWRAMPNQMCQTWGGFGSSRGTRPSRSAGRFGPQHPDCQMLCSHGCSPRALACGRRRAGRRDRGHEESGAGLVSSGDASRWARWPCGHMVVMACRGRGLG